MNHGGWIRFDNTIHAGHLMTAFTMVACAAFGYSAVISEINNIKEGDARRDQQIRELKVDSDARAKDVQGKIDDMAKTSRDDMIKLRDNMNAWFVLLDQKLDRKADKR